MFGSEALTPLPKAVADCCVRMLALRVRASEVGAVAPARRQTRVTSCLNILLMPFSPTDMERVYLGEADLPMARGAMRRQKASMEAVRAILSLM